MATCFRHMWGAVTMCPSTAVPIPVCFLSVLPASRGDAERCAGMGPRVLRRDTGCKGEEVAWARSVITHPRSSQQALKGFLISSQRQSGIQQQEAEVSKVKVEIRGQFLPVRVIKCWQSAARGMRNCHHSRTLNQEEQILQQTLVLPLASFAAQQGGSSHPEDAPRLT